MKLLVFLFFITINYCSYAETFESYGFDKIVGDTDVLIGIQNEKIIFEKYANNFDYNRPHLLHSLNKLFLNAFIGNLEKNNLLSSSKHIEHSINDTFTSNLTIDALMRMSSGLRTLSDPGTMETIEPGLIRPINEIPENLFDYYLAKSLPMYPPNTSYNYCFYDNNLLIQHLEDLFGKIELNNMLITFLDKNNFSDTSIIIKPSNEYLFDDYNSFLNKLLLKNNFKDMFRLLISRQFGFSSPKDIIKLAKLYLKNRNNLFTTKWKSDTFLSDPKSFTKSRTLDSFFAPFAYGRFWFLNTPHTDGTKAYPMLPDDVAFIYGLKGQILAIFPSQNAIYLRLSSDEPKMRFNREKSLNQFYNEFLKK
ncbi:MAG: serine hydrolase [Bacteriovorax sp.]|nr:serine hydrolase [Bacteriovorax sp.]